MKHFGAYSYRSPFKFCHYTLFTRKETPNFEAVFMLFRSVEKSFSSTWQSCRKEKKNGVNVLSFVTSWLESSFNGSPLLTFWVKSKVFHMVGSTRPFSNWLQSHLQWSTTGFLHYSLRELLSFSPTLMLPIWPQISPFSSSLLIQSSRWIST